jgi:hypothetical protein
MILGGQPMNNRAALLVSVIAMLLSATAADLSAQRRLIPLQVEYAPQPETWEELAAKCDVVAVVRLKNHRYVQPTNARPLRTVFEAEIIDVLRNAGPRGSVGSVIEITRYGGEMDTPTGTMIQEQAHFPRWSTGATLLLFLTWDETTGAFSLPYGPNSSFEAASDEKVRTFGQGRLARIQNGRRFSEFVNEIRAKVF